MNHMTYIPNPFEFSHKPVRTAVDAAGLVWFCAKDVCEVLEIDWSGSKTLRSMPENWRRVGYLPTPQGDQEAVFVSEAGLYRLAFRSNKPEAVRFTNWVCEEVLPSIRRTGGYGKVDARERIACSRQIVAVAEKLTSTRDAFAHTLLFDELRELSNLIGRPMPDIALLGTDIRQQPLPLTHPN